MLSAHWPLFDLRVCTPRLELRYPSDDDLATMAQLAREPVHDPDFMPFLTPWTRAQSPERERNSLRFWWGQRAGLSTDNWALSFLALDGGEPVGVQAITAEHFPVTRSVTSGSWLVQRHQGRGAGKEMRAAVLHLAFAGLGALAAHTSAFDDNTASLRVTEALGYTPNGSQIDDREGKPVRQLRFMLLRADWELRRRPDITIHNLEPCLPLLGLGRDD